jgi:predicted metal-dependent peptidase
MSVKTLKPDNKLYADLDRVRKYCITKSPGFAGVALLPQYHIVDPKDPLGKEYGFTDGKSIWLGPKLFKESPKAQAFVLIHEVLHVALRHPQRGLALRKARQANGLPWSGQVFNWAADAIIHFSMQNLSGWVNKPDIGIITFENLLPEDTLKARPPYKWNVESLFVHLMDNMVMPSIKEGKVGSVAQYGEQLPRNGKGMLDIELPEKPGEGSKGKEPIKPDTREEARNWENRVKRAAAGDRPGGIMKEILFDIPITRTPWRYILRRFISDAVMPITHVQPYRPSRHSIILDSFYKQTCSELSVPFFPSFRPKPGIRKIVVVIDTSGSIDDGMCEYFAGEIQTIRQKVGCDLTLITCDTEVHQTIDVRPFDNFHTIIKQNGGFKGRGGTDFVPGVAAAEKVPGAAVIVYLTDMAGPYPSKCRLPLLWASTSEQYKKPPVGQVFVLKQDD